IIDMPAVVLKKKLSTERKFIWIKRKMDIQKSEIIRAMDLDGIGFIKEKKRYYPRNRTASHIIGFTDIDNRGLSGVEKMFDRYLRGIPGKFILYTDANNHKIYKNKKEAIAGDTIVLTIDEYLQYVVEKELEHVLEKYRAKAAVSIMMDPYTGKILALANKPDFNPNFPGKFDEARRRNRAVTDMYEPGSTFKSILASAALEEKIVRVNQRFDCSKGYIRVGGRRIRDAHRHGILTFQQIIQKSSNVGAIQVGALLGKKRYYRYMRAFGFGQKTGSGLPGEISGFLAPPSRWSGLSLASMSIGQEIGITPLQLIRAYAAIANGGLLLKPYIVSEILSPSGDIIKKFKPTVVRRVISRRTSEIMKNILKTVVQEGGTAVNAAIKGNAVAGKTGTAQMVDPKTKRYSRSKYVSSFIGFVPADRPKFVLIVVVFEPKGAIYGGVVAAPVFRSIAEQALAYLGVPIEEYDHQPKRQIVKR
ncbi:MAG: penicillin-binding protein, partial [Nitrospirae bacterium]